MDLARESVRESAHGGAPADAGCAIMLDLPDARPSPYRNQSAERILDILEALGSTQDRITLAQVARTTDLDPSTAFRLLAVLTRRGFVHKRKEDGTYTVGYRLFRIGRRARQLETVRLHARLFLRDLAGTTGELVHLTALEGAQIVCHDRFDMPGAAALPSFVPGAFLDAHATAAGKALLAWREPAEVEKLYAAMPLRAHTRRTLAALPALLRDLRRIRERGFAIEDEELASGLRAVAAPLVNTVGGATMAVSVTVPAQRLSPSQAQALGERLVGTARSIVRYMVTREG